MNQTGAQLKRSGFTLVEVMVAMLAGSFVVIGAYYMGTISSRIFSEQLRRSETQMTLRSATELMRRDIGRAGFLAVRDTAELSGCSATAALGPVGPTSFDVAPRPISAASVQLDANGRQMLILTGNMTTSEHYLVSASNGTDVLLQTANEGFRRSFVNPVDGLTFLPNRFNEAFFPDPTLPARGRMVSAMDVVTGHIFLRDLAGFTGGTTPPTLQLATPLPVGAGGGGPGNNCMNAGQVFIAPVSTIRYSVQVPGANLARVGGRTYMTGGGAAGQMHPVLVREELDATSTVIPGTERVVLDSIAANDPNSFSISAIHDDAIPPARNLVFTATPETLPIPQRIRSLSIQLIVESSERGEGDQIAQRAALNARRVLRFEVMMPNTSRNPGAL